MSQLWTCLSSPQSHPGWLHGRPPVQFSRFWGALQRRALCSLLHWGEGAIRVRLSSSGTGSIQSAGSEGDSSISVTRVIMTDFARMICLIGINEADLRCSCQWVAARVPVLDGASLSSIPGETIAFQPAEVGVSF